MKFFKVGRGLALAIALAVGMLLTVQVGFNTTFGKQVGSPLAGSLVSFTVGVIILSLFNITPFSGKADWKGLRRMPWWAYGSGVVGAYYVTCTIVVAPVVGLAAMSATVVAGQMIGSLIIDKFGALGFEKKAVGLWQWFGTTLLPVATALILGVADGGSAVRLDWLLLLSFSAGLILSLSVGLNSMVGSYLKNPVASALINFLSGIVLLLIFAVVAFGLDWATLDTAKLGANLAVMPWWAWLGGLMGSIYVVGVTVVGPVIGAALTNVLLIAGQLTMSLTADTIGLFRAEPHPLTLFRVAGAILLVIVVMLIKSVKSYSEISPKYSSTSARFPTRSN
jgi:transporter family-2 protein